MHLRWLAIVVVLVVLGLAGPARAGTSDRFLTLADGRSIHVLVAAPAVPRQNPRRGVVLLPGPIVKADFYPIPVPGYDAADILAGAGYYVFAVDLPGFDGSSGPANGADATSAYNLAAVREVIDQLRAAYDLPKLDVYGEGGTGGALAVDLAADVGRVRTIACDAMIYENPTALTYLAAEATLAGLQPSDHGYARTEAPMYGPFVASSPADVQLFTFTNEPDLYPSGSLAELVAGPLPLYDAAAARVPGLVLWGANDFVDNPGDMRQMAEDYGSAGRGVATYVELAGCGHIQRIESAACAASFWSALLGFLDSH